jgi:uncharacterized protein
MLVDVFPFVSLFLLGGGFIAGFYGGSVGGGGLVSFPVLLFIGMPMQFAIATNRFAAIFAELAGAVQFHRHGKLDLRLALLIGTIEAVGAVIGAQLVLVVPKEALNVIVAVLLVSIALLLLLRPSLGRMDGRMHGRRRTILLLLSFPLGIYGGFFGTGYGTILMLMLAWGGLSLLQGAAIARLAGFIVSVAGSVSFLFLGLIRFPEGIALGAGYALGAWFGVRFGLNRGQGYIRVLLLLIALVTAAKLVWEVV